MATDQKSKMLIVMALRQESEGLIEKLGYSVHYTGVGQISAAQKTTEVIIKYKPTWILNLGTAGSRDFLQGSLIECTQFIYRGLMSPFLKNSFSVDAFSNLPKGICGSADHVEKGELLKNCNVMDMEAFAIAKVCETYKIKFNSIKYITDSSDEKMFEDWQKNLKQSALVLSDFLKTIEVSKN